jgi:hypothetical protein
MGERAPTVGGKPTAAPKDGGGREHDRHAVRDERHRGVVAARGHPRLVLPADGVAEAVAQVHARVAKPRAREARRQGHGRVRLLVPAVLHGAHKVARDEAQGLHGPHVRHGVRALVCGEGAKGRWLGGRDAGAPSSSPLARTRGTQRRRRGPRRARIEGEVRVRLERVAEDVEAARCSNLWWHGGRVFGVDEAERRP